MFLGCFGGAKTHSFVVGSLQVRCRFAIVAKNQRVMNEATSNGLWVSGLLLLVWEYNFSFYIIIYIIEFI